MGTRLHILSDKEELLQNTRILTNAHKTMKIQAFKKRKSQLI